MKKGVLEFCFTSLQGILFMAMIFCCNRSFAQSWNAVGTVGFSTDNTNRASLAIDGSGIPYVAYAQGGSGKATVMKYVGGSWVTVGAAEFSAGYADYISLAIDGSGTPYVAYGDGGNSARATVMKYNGSSWVTVGSAGFSAAQAQYTSLAIDGSGTPYVAYRDVYPSNLATVMKYNGTSWVAVGSVGFSPANVEYTSLAIDASGTPYVAYFDGANGGRATVMKYNGSSWASVGSVGFSAGAAVFTSMAIDPSGRPYVAYRDGGNSNKASVMKYNGTSWTTVGSAGFSAYTADYTSLTIDGSGIPYVAFRDGASSGNVTVMKYNGSSWVVVGSAGFSVGQIDYYTSMARNSSGTPYVAYSDNGLSQRVTVMKFGTATLPAISGTTTVCQGATTTLSNDTTGGTWSSNNTSVATVNSSTGVVTGVAGGTAVIIYAAAGSSVTAIVNVDPLPATGTITGSFSLAVGSAITLSNSVTGGTWSSSNTAVATINSTGLVSGIAAGTAIISYTTTNSCGNSAATRTISVNNVSWINAGSPGFSAGTTGFNSIAIDGSGTPYVVYQDAGNSSKATVMKFNGTSWVTVGSAGFSAGVAGYLSLALDGSGNPYVAYRDGGTSNRATVMKYNGTSWVTVGTAGFSTGTATFTSIAFDASGTPYVACKDAGTSNKVTVRKFNGSSWVTVGAVGFSAGTADYTSIAIDGSGMPYVAYRDGSAGSRATVMKYNGSSWITVGSAGFSAGIATYTSLAVDGSGTPYVAYSDNISGNKATVMKYNGSSWVSVGSVGFTAASADYISLTLDGSGVPYVACRDWGHDSYATVMKYNGSSWVEVAGAGFSAGQVAYTSLTLSSGGKPYVAYTDGGNSNKTTVMTLGLPAITGTATVCTGAATTLGNTSTGGTWSSSSTAVASVDVSTGVVTGVAAGTATISYTNGGVTVTQAVTVNPSPNAGTITGDSTILVGLTKVLSNATTGGAWASSNTAIATVGSTGVVTGVAAGTATISYIVTNSCGSAVATKTITAGIGAWTNVGSTGFSAGQVEYTSLAIDGSGTPYVAYRDAVNGTKATVMKYSGGSWVTVGAAGFSAGEATYTSIAFDGSNAPHVAYTDYGNSGKVTVKKYNGSSWVTLGVVGFSAGSAFEPHIAIDGAGTPYVSYKDGTVSNKQTVKKFNGSSWVTVGTVGFTASGAHWGSFAIDGSGTPYVAFSDDANSTKATVMKFNGSTWVTVGSAGFSAGQAIYTSLAIDGSGTPYVAYSDYSSSQKATVMKFNGSSWVTVGTVGFSAGSVSHNSLTIEGGTPYLAYYDGGNGGRATVMKYNGSTWTAVGTAGFSAGSASSTSLDMNSSGTPYVAYIDGANSNKATVKMFGPAPLSATQSQTNLLCNGVCTGSATVTASSGTAPYSYSWAPSGGSAATATSLCAGSYTCTITDAASNNITKTFVITQPSAISTSTVTTSASCYGANNGAINLTVSGGTPSYTYSWAPGGITTEDRTALSAGTYTCTITDANGCTKTQSATITQPSAPVSATTDVTNVACNGGNNGAIDLTPSGGTPAYTYSWSGGATTQDRTGLSAGGYSVTITDANGCTGAVSVTVTQPSTPVSGTTVVTNVACNGNNTGAINLTPTGGSSPYTYLWNSAATTEDRTGLTAGNYSVTITDANGCTGTVSATVTQPSALSVSAGVTNPACFGLSNGNATVSVSGGTPGYTYSWAPSGGTGSTATGLAAGSYTCTITDANGCTKTQVTTISDPAPVTITGIGSNSPLCAGLTLNFSGTAVGAVGAVNYYWQGPDSFTSTVVNPSVSFVTASAAGTYTMFATDANGCTAAASTDVTINPLPDAGTILGDSSVNLAATTALTATASGGTWSASNTHATVSSTGVVTGVSLGTVTISYSVANDCDTAVATKIITVSGLAVSGSPLVCVGTTTTLTGTPLGGTWTSGNTPLAVVNAAGVVTGLSAGAVNITYNAGGSITVTTVTVQTTPAVITGVASICNGASVTLVTTPSGGTWTTSEPTVADITSAGILSGLSLGNAVISYTLSNGCARSVVATVNNVPGEISGFTTTCVGGTTTLTNSVSGGVFSSANSSIATCTMGGVVGGVATGSTLISYSIGGCRVTTMVSVTAAPAITGTAAACVGATTSLSNALTGGVWSSGNGSVAEVDPSGLVLGVSGGTATISYTLSSGCARTRVVTINATPVVNGPSTICVGGGSVNLTSAPATTSWINSTPSVATITGSGLLTAVSAGSTTISVVSAAGCTNSAVINVTSLPTIIGTLTACMSGTTSLSGSVTGGAWSSSSTGVASVNSSTGVVTGVNLGAATISYSLGAGCLRTAVVTVTALPSIAGTPVMCVGGSVALAGSPSGGSWSTAYPLTATISGTGVVTGQASGNTNIIYTNATTGCSRSVIATINATPGAFTGTTNICVGTTSSLSNATPGGTWSSSNPAFASAAVATGVITGAGAGNATITYRIGTCLATTPVTVRALPNVITGGMQTVVGATATLANTTIGGTWSSSNPATGTISATGVVTGLAAGTSNVIYTGPNGCIRSAVVTVNIPPTLPGPRTVCVGSAINIYMGGVSSWSSSTPSVATVSAGIVTGVTPGTTTITYVLTAGGYATTDVTVLSQPAAITGALGVCTGSTTSLGSATAGGTWASANNGLATVGTNGIVTGVAPGSVMITYSLGTGCRRTVSVTVSGTPSPITGTPAVCVGATMYPYLAAVGSGTWSSSNPAIAAVPSTHGAVAGIAAGTALISFTNVGGCSSTREVTVSVCPSRGMLPGTTGVTDLTNGNFNFYLYPNPTKGTFSVNTPEAGTLSVSTIDGREVMKHEVKAGVTELTLPSDITTGVYMCRFTGEAGAATTVRLVFEQN